MLELQVLGTPHITLNGLSVQGFVTRKAEALLLYLALNPQIHPREVIATLFWPVIAEPHAKNNLRRTLPNLRQLVGDYLTIDRYTIVFNRQLPYRLDGEEFSNVVSGVLSELTLTPSSAQRLREALAHYRASFLDGLIVHDAPVFESWVKQQREWYHRLAVTGLTLLADYYLSSDDPAVGLAVTQRLLLLEPWHEQAYRQQMKLLAKLGQYTAALTQFERCRLVLAEKYGSAPSAETVACYEQVKQHEMGAAGRSKVQATHQPPNAPPYYVDWGEIPRPTAFYGRSAEVAQLKAWLLEERCTLITILGMGGSGKTALAAHLARLVANLISPADSAMPFTHIIWRSLHNAPPLTMLLAQWLKILSNHQQTDLPDTLPEQLTLLLSYLRQQRCLLLLDNLESIMVPKGEAGFFRPGYEAYGQMIRNMGETMHQSCLLLTSREQPLQAARLERDYLQVRTLTLSGLPAESGIKILQATSLSALPEQMTALVARYSGNPLALKLVAETIQDFYSGDIRAFLEEETLVFDDIRHVLDQQFERLSELERDLLLWLAMIREPIAADALRNKLTNAPPKRLFLEALRSLHRRSLLETTESNPTAARNRDTLYFSLQNVIAEYLTDRLLTRFCEEVTQGELELFHQYGLVNAQAKEYIRDTQTRLFLQPLCESLVKHWGKSEIAEQLYQIFQQLRTTSPRPRGYAVANLLHLWLELGIDLANYDFSRLEIRQANLRGVRLPQVNFANADLTGTVFTEIFNAVLSLAFSPDGQLLAVATTDGVVRLWRVAGMQLIGTCPGNGRWVWSVCFSPDGQLLATACADRAARIWQIDLLRSGQQDAAEWQVQVTLTGHTDAVFAVCFSPDSQQLASASADGTLRLWDARSGQHLQTLIGHSDAVNDVAYSPTGHTLASASRDQCVRLWRVASGQCLQLLQGHQHEVKSVAFRPDGEMLATAGDDGIIRIWHTETGQLYRTIQSDATELLRVIYHPDGESIVVNGRDYSIRLWSVEHGQIRRTWLGHTNAIHTFAFSPDGQTLVSGGWDKTVRFWDVQRGHALYTLQGYQNNIESIAIGDPAPALFTDHENGVQETVSLMAGKYLANGNSDHLIYLWDLHRGEHRQTLRGHTAAVRTVAFHPAGRLLASGSEDRTVRLWQVDEQKSVLLHTLYGHTGEITKVAFAPDGLCFASASSDQMIRLWETANGRSQRVLRGHSKQVNTLTFCIISAQAQQLLVSGDDESNLFVWEMRQFQELRIQLPDCTQPDDRLTAVPPNGIHTLAFTPAGCILAAGGAEPIIQLWQMSDRRPLATLRGHTSSIYGLAFSTDGKTLASSGGDQTIRLWDIRSAQLKHTLYGHHGVVQSVLFHPNGHWLISSSSDETMKVWELGTGRCLRTLRPAGLYQGMNIMGVVGITAAQRATLKALGAVENEATN